MPKEYETPINLTSSIEPLLVLPPDALLMSKQKPPPKIRGSQFIRREEKQKPKNIPRPQGPIPKNK